jgi:hypothetical protein
MKQNDFKRFFIQKIEKVYLYNSCKVWSIFFVELKREQSLTDKISYLDKKFNISRDYFLPERKCFVNGP